MLTTQQKQVLDNLNNWYSSSERGINLAAKAGYGKTYVLSLFIQQQLNSKIFCTIIAPTHSALFQLKLKIGVDSALLEYKTVAKALSLYPIISNSTAKVIFGQSKISFLKGLVIVDESSMLSEADVETLITISDKIIFSGDNNQLAPVKKKSGYKVLQALPQLTLTQMMRAESQAIIEAGNNGLKIAQYVPDSSEDGSVVKYFSEAYFTAAFLREVKSNPIGECVYITYTNADAQAMNLRAHKAITKRETLQSGDSVRLYSASTLGQNNDILQINEVKDLGLYFDCDGQLAALPHQYKVIEDEVESITDLFANSLGNKKLAARLTFLRSIAEIDFPYCITTHKSQGASIRVVFANSQKLHGRKAFYVAYTRAIEKLCVVARKSNTKGVRISGTMWVNKKKDLAIECEDALDLPLVQNKIAEVTEDIPSISHLACVINPSHAGKSAKGWTLI
jgi:hypothetical protein